LGLPGNEGPKPLSEYAREGISSLPSLIEEALTVNQDLHRASELFLSEAQKLTPCQIASIYSLDESADEITAVLFGTNLSLSKELGHTFPLAGSWIEQHLHLGLPHIESPERAPGSSSVNPKFLASGIKSSLWVPLTDKGRFLGVIALHSQDPNAFDDKIMAEVSALGCRLAPSVGSAARYLRVLQHEKFAQALNRTSRVLTSTLNIQQVLETICRECCTVLEVAYAILCEVAGEELVCRAAWATGAPQTYGDGSRLSLNEQVTSVPARVVFTRQPEVINEARDHAHAPAEERFWGVNFDATMGVPLIARDRVIGVLELAHVGTGRKFTRCCLQMAEALASNAAIALENAQLNEQLANCSKQIADVDEVAQIVTSTLNINEVYDRFAGVVKNLVGFDQINISVINADHSTLTVRYISGLTQPGRCAGDIIPLSGTETERATQSRRSFITHDLVGNITCKSDDSLLKAGLRSRMLVPVSCWGQVIGTITLHSRQVGAYGQREQALLERVAHQIAPAVENARLYEEATREKERAAGLLAQLKAVLTEADAGLLLINDQQQVLWMNEKFGEFFGITGIGSILSDDAPAQMNVLRDNLAACFVNPDAFFAERDRIGADHVFAGYVEEVELVYPQLRTLQEFTTPVYAAEQTYLGRLWVYHDVTAQKRKEEALRHSESQQRVLLEAIPDAMFRISKDGTYLSYLAPADFRTLIPSEEFLGKSVESVMPAEVAQPTMACIAKALSGHQVQAFEYRLTINDQVRDYEARIVASGPAEVLAIVRDVTERRSLEAQFLQSQKMESLGRLAGGIAHDFNNLLGGIMGYASLLKNKLDPSSETHEYASIIENATKRGAQLTHQLLTAARRSRFNSRPMDLNEVTQEVVQILSRTLPKGVRVASDLQLDLPLIPGDQSQVHQVLMNLCINAADAMPDGGTLTLSSKEAFLGEGFCRQHLSAEPGRYVQLTISDTGIGISEADLLKIFDPFFTTKEPGKGTGLGLAVVDAIVKNHNGIIEVSSVPGEGSLFIVYLPVYSDKQM
jgi:signal transduction histidine kinase/GAF domain-containing protein